MGKKGITGIVVLIIGVALIIYAVHSMNRIAEAKGTAHALTSPFSENPVGKVAGDIVQNKASQYDVTVMILLISGIVLTVAGCGITFFYRRK